MVRKWWVWRWWGNGADWGLAGKWEVAKVGGFRLKKAVVRLVCGFARVWGCYQGFGGEGWWVGYCR